MSRTLCGIIILLIIGWIGGCATSPGQYGESRVLAVWDLENFSPTEESINPDLGELLSAKVIETIQEAGTYTVVSRERLLLALEELNLGASSLVNEATRLEIGKMIGAEWMIFGGYHVIGDTMRLDLRLVEVETGKILKAVKQTVLTINLIAWLEAAKKATNSLF